MTRSVNEPLGSGRLAGTADAPRMRVSLSGRELELDGRRLSSLGAELEAGLAAAGKLAVIQTFSHGVTER